MICTHGHVFITSGGLHDDNESSTSKSVQYHIILIRFESLFEVHTNT
jgi:hypothetical protein